ncbi:uncharacterized protein [Spinacia oleracea]|uniref:Uncharacterized protein LOC110799324 isoform X3 n=2 Tax=Spinacia oleracea TaxID=3562 RepID=A0A9R0J2Y1_SPIOL|nr:uncharacterized protein LOC110799324 isoform X1 [Spinacia oleracea]XP_056683881.1 uncharacterized protein LOC110799324 isoform X1 [Spinacia oleracea]XP_056683882.1 uncharacterized protein LOC110799324 isoform X1 [Spinacia oleracea]XP_056683883.1 uncharacterized protein LOC110799324 isoform X1 [Spinacia oleracea]XP_056683884.1 uncharacterized protein LOC110799324 isoform X1 [Spinacia oleracea]XP_056683885.1 uncharacterized protein LOC110799324 isoform X1 [Spinacia oleracea]XP_056683886.1 un
MVKFYKNEKDSISFDYVFNLCIPEITYLDRIRYHNDRELRWNTDEARISTWQQDDMVCAIEGNTKKQGIRLCGGGSQCNGTYGLKYPVGTPYVLPSWDELGTDQTAEPDPVFNPRDRPSSPPRHTFIPIFPGGKRTRKSKLNSDKSGDLEDEREHGTMSFPPRTWSQGAAEITVNEEEVHRERNADKVVGRTKKRKCPDPTYAVPSELSPGVGRLVREIIDNKWNEKHILFSVREIGISLTRSTLRFCFDSKGKVINEVMGAIAACYNYDNRASNQFYMFPPFFCVLT